MQSLTILLEKNQTKPLYEQIYQFIKEALLEQRIPAHSKMPSKRQLAQQLQVSLNTIETAYHQLLLEGYLYSSQRRGYFASDIALQIKQPTIMNGDLAITSPETHSQPNYDYNCSADGVDSQEFPYRTWAKTYEKVLNRQDPEILKTSHPQGDLALRQSLCHYLFESRGVICQPDQIVLSAGMEFLMEILLILFKEREDFSFAVEDPSNRKFDQLFGNHAVEFNSLVQDEDGIRISELERFQPSCIILTPAHQFPTGLTMPITRRLEILNWASQEPGRYIIEDDYNSEFQYSGRPIPSLQGLDQNHRVIYCSTLSKSIAPSLRISYMVLPPQLLKIYQEKLPYMICPVPRLDQMVLQQFIEDGHFARHLNRMRALYNKKREQLVATLEEWAPVVQVQGQDAGHHIVLKVNNGMSENELIERAKARGIKLDDLSRYCYQQPVDARPQIILGFAKIGQEQIDEMLEKLADAWEISVP